MKKKLITSIVFFLYVSAYAQAPDTIWTKTYGDSSYDFGSSIIQTNNNSFIISGTIGTQLSGNSYTTDIWVFGIDENGTKLWSHNYGGMGGGEIENASDDEFFVAAETFNQGSWEDMQLLKINSLGDTLWTKTFYYTQHDYAPDIERTPDGGLVLLEYTYGFSKGALLIKVNESGDTLWTRFFPDDLYSLNPSSPQIDNDKGILFLIQELDSSFIYKTDSLGNLLSINKVCTGPYSANKFLMTEDGNYLILGRYSPTSDSSVIWISHIDNNFSPIWSNTYFSSTKFSYPTNVIKSNTEGYLIIGYESEESYSPSNGTILKINNSGDLIWRKSFGGVLSEKFRDILMLGNNQFFVIGTTESFGAGENDAWVLKFSADTATSAVKNDDNSKLPQGYILNQNYPNPFNPSTKISWKSLGGSWQTLKIYDVLGNEVATLVDEYRSAGNYEVEWDASSYPSGVYFYQLRTENYTETKKMILLK
jgi:hypothetical protein